MDDEHRAQTFAALRKTVGVTAKALFDAGSKRIEKALAGGGMQPSHRAAKVLRCAELADEFSDGNLDKVLPTLDEKLRRRLLKRFPGIADPSADKLLLVCDLAASPTLDSNGLRVLRTLGYCRTWVAYTAGYKAGVARLREYKILGPKALEAFALPRAHGRELNLSLINERG